MQRPTARPPAARALAGILLALAIPGVGVVVTHQVAAGSSRPTPILTVGRAAASVPTGDIAASTIPAATVGTRTIGGTGVAIPVPAPELGSVVQDLQIPLEGQDGAVVHGVAFYRPGPISGSVVGGTSVVYDDASSAVRRADGAVPDAALVARAVEPSRAPEVLHLGGHTVLAWPDSDVVPADSIPQEPRSVSRYVVLVRGAMVMVTFDGVSRDEATSYLAAVAGAL